MFNAFGSILGGNLARRNFNTKVTRAQHLSAIQTVLQEKFGHSTLGVPVASALKGTVLVVQCANASLSQEVRLREEELIDAITEKTHEKIVTGIMPKL